MVKRRELFGLQIEANDRLYGALRLMSRAIAQRNDSCKWAALWKRAAKNWREISNGWELGAEINAESWEEALSQRNEAARLFWRMKAERDGYRELYNETHTAFGEVWQKVVDANRCIAKLEEDRAKVLKHVLSTIRDRDAADKHIEELKMELATMRNVAASFESSREDIAKSFRAATRRVEELEKELAARDKRTCETCANYHAGTYTCRNEWAPLACVLNDFSEWQEQSP